MMERFRKESNSPPKGRRFVMSLRLWVLFALVIWIFLPPPRHGYAACAPWEGGPCIDIRPTPGGGERPDPPERPERPEGTGGGGCATLPTHEGSTGNSGNGSPASFPAGTPSAEHPNTIWDGSGHLYPAEGYTWTYPDKPNNYDVRLFPAGTPHAQRPNVEWDGNGKLRPAEGYTWASSDPKNLDVVFLSDGTPYPRLKNVVWAGNGLIRPANGYMWATDPPASSGYKVVRDVVVANWSANWGTTDAGLAKVALGGFEDAGLMNWLAAHANFGRYPDDGTSPLSVSGSTLRFKDRFFAAGTSPAQRENLVAFEGGKLFYNRMKDTPLQGGGTLGSWFRGYYGGHTSIIEEMMDTKHGDEAVHTTDFYDEHSRFASVFRSQALQLEKPKGYWEKKEWEDVMREFKLRMDQVLPGR